MPGLLDLANSSKQQAMQGFGQAARNEQSRNANNEAIKQQAEAQQKQGMMSGAGTLAAGLMTGNPVMAVMGGIGLLGSLF